MATKALASSPSGNSDLTRQTSIYSLTIAELQNNVSESYKSFGSMSMDELVRNIWTAEESQAMAAPFAPPIAAPAAENLSRQGSLSLPKHVGNKTVEEVWKEISGGCSAGGDDRKMKEACGAVYKEPTFGEMTLEDFLAKAGVVRDGEVRVSPDDAGRGEWGSFPAAEVAILQGQIQQQQQQQIELFTQRFGGGEVAIDGSNGGHVGLGFGNGLVVNGEGPGGRGKRKAVQEPVDKVAQQRQKRMIKNRESAARSRERKQAYTVELETLVTQLEEENAELLAQEVEQTKKRFKEYLRTWDLLTLSYSEFTDLIGPCMAYPSLGCSCRFHVPFGGTFG